MTSKRDSGLFLPGSIGRTQGAQIIRNGSHESLTAHPLLSPTAPTSSASSVSSTNSSETQIPATSVPPARYVPYTPRQRGAPTSATTGTTMHSSIQASPQSHPFQGDATSKLQLMNLKAAAQKGGLDTASIGWAVLEKLGTETDHGPEWNEIWSAISTGKATLLLPLEPHLANEPITLEFMRDHIALCDGASRNNVPIITLSGLRGTLVEETLTFRSTLHPSSKSFQAILNPATRASALAALPPLPIFSSPLPTDVPTPSDTASLTASPPSPKSSTGSASSSSYPTFDLPSHHPSLPLPPRPSINVSSPSKPPLPPRPGARTVSLTASSTPTHASPTPSRLSNPFASLFGRASTPALPASPPINAVPLHPTSSDGQAVESSSEHVLGVPAFTLATRINRRDVAKSLLRALHSEIRTNLHPAPSWISERVEDFAAKSGLMPFDKIKPKSKLDSTVSLNSGAGGYVVSPGVSSDGGVEGVGRRFQEFYIDLEEELSRRKWAYGKHIFGRGLGQHFNGGGAPSSENTSGDEKVVEKDSIDEKEKEKARDSDDSAEDEKDKKVRDVMEAVEQTICSLFYDRIFLQPNSDDASHDEALSSRIAAVNLLDLNLSHLGVEVGSSGPEVEAVVKACGESLTQLDATRSPSEKAAVLVSAHKILVDGLSKLPPIELKSEDEVLDEKTPLASTFNKKHTDAEEDDRATSPGPSTAPSNMPMLLEPGKVVTSPDAKTPPTNGLNDHPPQSETTSLSATPSSSDDTISPPRDTISSEKPTAPTPVSGDMILPLMIFAVVKANPPHLVSHLLYTQRFRYEGVGGEESYCLINLLAVAEFLENVDLAALGLGESQKTVLSTAELTPIPVSRSALGSEHSSPRSTHASLRGRVEQQVDAIAGSANKVISGVVDSSFGVFRALLPSNQNTENPPSGETADLQETAPWNASRPGFGLLRRDTGFSIASLAASLPGAVGGRPKKDEEAGQQMIEVPSRPGSSRSIRVGVEDATSSSSEGSDDEDDDGDEEEEEYDTRSIRSFESMMSSRSKGRKRAVSGRKSITDRLASMPGLSRLSQSQPHDAAKSSPPTSRRSSLLPPNQTASSRFETPASSRGASPVTIRISPPNSRFLDCTEDDIKVSEVGELLREYRRLVEAVRAMGGFHDE